MRRSSTRSPFERHDDVRISSPAHLVTIAIAIAVAIPLIAQTSSPPPVSAQIVVSATKLPETPIDLPADTTVITGAELQAMGVQTLADALATAAGVEAFAGSDQGSTLPNVSLWGLKEFDAYLVELDGVPVGGTFDPDLQQIDVRNIKRIEIVRGFDELAYHDSSCTGRVPRGGEDCPRVASIPQILNRAVASAVRE